MARQPPCWAWAIPPWQKRPVRADQLQPAEAHFRRSLSLWKDGGGGAIGDERTHQSLETLTSWPQVEKVMPVQKRYL